MGAVAELESMPCGAGEFWIALAGPLASLALAGFFWLSRHTISPPGLFWFREIRPVLRFGYAMNLVVATFNMLPCFPMDGGRLLRSGLAVFISRAAPQYAGQAFLIATKIAVRYVSWLVALGMMAWTVFGTGNWMDLVLFPLLLLCAEAEYWLRRTDNDASKIDDV
jgi:Zn-dependent protease